MKEIFEVVSNVGFPIAVSIYLLVRIESRIELLTVSINNLSNSLTNLLKNQ